MSIGEAIMQGLGMGANSVAERLDKRDEYRMKQQLAEQQQQAMLDRIIGVQNAKTAAGQEQLNQMSAYADQLEASGDPENLAMAQSIRQAVALGGAKNFGQFQKAYNDKTLLPAKQANLEAKTGLTNQQTTYLGAKTEGQNINNEYAPQILQNKVEAGDAGIEYTKARTQGQNINNEYAPQINQNKITESNSRIQKNNAQITNTRTAKTRQDMANPSGGGRGSQGQVSYIFDPSGQYITGQVDKKGQIREYKNPIPKTAVPGQAPKPKPKAAIPKSNVNVSLF